MWGKMLIDECSIVAIKIVVSSQNYFYQQDTTESLLCWKDEKLLEFNHKRGNG